VEDDLAAGEFQLLRRVHPGRARGRRRTYKRLAEHLPLDRVATLARTNDHDLRVDLHRPSLPVR